ncbi:MAG: putative bifunctional diguanylate cyclase/phosphodiesterase [bacterium]
MALIKSHRHEKELKEIAQYDSITTLPRRNYFMKTFESLLETAKAKDETLGVAHLDLTRFDRVSETLGYSATEEVLSTVASRIESNLPESAFVTRTLGDEFLIVLPDVSSREHIKHQLNEVVTSIRRPISIKDESFLFSARIGTSLFPDTGKSMDALLRQAGSALKESTAESSSSITFYLDQMDAGPGQKNLEQDFLEALENNQLHLNYQPTVDLSDGSIDGLEALVRWNHPEVGYVPPPTIISLAETLGEMSTLGQCVMSNACRQTHEWNQQYDLNLNLGVNVSALEFQQGKSFNSSVKEILTASGLRNKNLTLEITETEVMEDLDFTINLLKALTEFSVRVAIDDYGTGQSSLEYLARFPEPIIKIDRAFVDGVASDSTKKAIVENTLKMARDLNIETIAEGVERQDEENFLRNRGCDWYQGYYFSKPVDASTFEKEFLI